MLLTLYAYTARLLLFACSCAAPTMTAPWRSFTVPVTRPAVCTGEVALVTKCRKVTATKTIFHRPAMPFRPYSRRAHCGYFGNPTRRNKSAYRGSERREAYIGLPFSHINPPPDPVLCLCL